MELKLIAEGLRKAAKALLIVPYGIETSAGRTDGSGQSHF